MRGRLCSASRVLSRIVILNRPHHRPNVDAEGGSAAIPPPHETAAQNSFLAL
jgi:hypothetical protein